MAVNWAERRRLIKMFRERARRSRGSTHNAFKTHCPAGHAYAGSNVTLRVRYRDGSSWIERRCVECRRKQR